MDANFDPQAYRHDLETTAQALRITFGEAPDFAVVFGSGLGNDFLENHVDSRPLDFSQIPNLLSPQVDGHRGRLVCVRGEAKKSRRALILVGRIHYYEGYAPERVVLPVRALALWGVKRLLLTNAAGSIRERLKVGRLAQIRDHLNLTGANPLRGPNLDYLGTRFPSLDQAYRNEFSQELVEAARRCKISLPPAVYVGIPGPSYETAAEIQAFRKLGGDLVGMSTVLESIAATHAGMQVAALSAVTNSCLKKKAAPNHHEVLENAQKVDRQLSRIVSALLEAKGGGGEV